MLKRKLERCERHVESVNERLGQAEASRTDPARRRGYTDRYGHGYVKQFRDDRDSAVRKFACVRKELDEEEADLQKAKAMKNRDD